MYVESFLPLLPGNLVAGQNLFIHYMPPDIVSGTVILPSLAGSAMSWEIPGWRKNSAFQVICRDAVVQDAMIQANAVFAALVTNKKFSLAAIPARNIPALLVSYIRAQADPQPYPREFGKTWEVNTNYFTSYVIQGS